MTTGVLIFAFNNEHIDYLAMANWSAQNIRRHLNLPVAVVTNMVVPLHYQFEQVIYAETTGVDSRKFEDIPESVTWFNGNRVDAYSLSPWSQTLLLDADYVVASNQLKTILDSDQDFLAHNRAHDITNHQNFDDHDHFGNYRMPMWWATVIMFRRSQHAELIFDCMQMIRNNWNHYRSLYNIRRSTYRNDFALSIALGIVNGHTLDYPSIPWSLASLGHDQQLTQINQDNYRVDFDTQTNRPKWIQVTQDFHAMGKAQLGAIIDNCC